MKAPEDTTASPRRRFFVIIACLLVATPLWQYITPYDSMAATFADDMGREVEVRSDPSRIVSLAPHITELLFTLGLGERVVGVTQYSDFPDEARSKEKVGSYVKLNLEKIVSLQPDLVLATADGNPKFLVDRLAELDIPVFVINTGDIADIYRNIRSIGNVTGKKREGDAAASEMEGRINAVTEKVKGRHQPRVFIQLGLTPLYTAAGGTFVDDLITLAGGGNIAGDGDIRYPVYSIEEIIKREPDVIFVVLMGTDVDLETLAFWKRWNTIPAVRNGRIYNVNPDIVNRPSIRIAEGLEQIARRLHPEAFKAPDDRGPADE